MNIKDRIEAMTSNLGTLTLGTPVRYGADAAQRHAHSFSVLCEGTHIAEVLIRPQGEADQAKIDEFALALFHLLGGSESRVAFAEQRISNLRHACQEKDREIARMRDQLAHFERGSIARGPSYAVADPNGVWLVGRPASDAFGFFFKSWHDLATEYPGLRPCGVQSGEGRDGDQTYIVMRPIGDLAPVNAPEAGDLAPVNAPEAAMEFEIEQARFLSALARGVTGLRFRPL